MRPQERECTSTEDIQDWGMGYWERREWNDDDEWGNVGKGGGGKERNGVSRLEGWL